MDALIKQKSLISHFNSEKLGFLSCNSIPDASHLRSTVEEPIEWRKANNLTEKSSGYAALFNPKTLKP
jgi:hypothetical protein